MLRTVVLIVLMLVSLNVVAGGAKLSKAEYQQLNKAIELMVQEQWDDARTVLLDARAKVHSAYAKALLSYHLAQVDIQQNLNQQAIERLERVHAQNALPKQQQNAVAHTLAKLYCAEQKWARCATVLSHWMGEAAQQVRANDHALLAQAYAQQERWEPLLSHIATALELRPQAPESWHQLKVAAHIKLAQWHQAVAQQQLLVKAYPSKPSHWRQWVVLQLQAGQRKAALATQRIAYERGLLRLGSDYRLLAELLLSQDIPYYAGKVLERGLEQGMLAPTRSNLRLLSQAWISAKEMPRALQALQKLYQLQPNENNALRFVQLLMQEKQWDDAQAVIEQTLQRQPKELAGWYFMSAVSCIHSKRFAKAHEDLLKAKESKRYRLAATSWLRYLKQLEAGA